MPLPARTLLEQRLTSGDANGGVFSIDTGAGIGTGAQGTIIIDCGPFIITADSFLVTCTTFTITASNLNPEASDTARGFVEIATQTEIETGTDTTRPITPGRAQFHLSALKAWAYADAGTGLNASYNVTSNTDDGSGINTITWATDFSSDNYAAVAMTILIGGAQVRMTAATAQDAGTIQIRRGSAVTTLTDNPFSILAAGDQ